MFRYLLLFLRKLAWIPLRLLCAVLLLPVRIGRLFRHVNTGIHCLLRNRKPKIAGWWADLLFLLIDLSAIPEVAETLMELLKLNTRPLLPTERKLAVSVFGNSIWLSHVRIDEQARIGCKARKIAYVSFFTINSWGRLQPFTLVHELVHIWQYQRMGSVYIPRAIRAQRSKHGYDYGGVEALRNHLSKNSKFTDFNLEQQAEIVADYFAVREGEPTAWGKASKADLRTYQYFLAQILESDEQI